MNDSYTSMVLPPKIPEICPCCGAEFTDNSEAKRIGIRSSILEAIVAYRCSECGYVKNVEDEM